MFFAIVSSIAILTASVWILWKRVFPSWQKLDMPYLAFDDGDNSPMKYADMVAKGYREYLQNDRPFCMDNPVDSTSPMVILPFKYLEEVRKAPDTRLSLPLHLEKNSILNHIGGPEMSDQVIHAAKLDLNRALNRDKLTGLLQEECVTAFATSMPKCEDWTTVHLYPIILNLFARMAARVLVGPDLRDEWQKLAVEYVTVVLKAPATVRAKYHPSLYWVAKYFHPDVKEVYKHRWEAGRLLEPTIKSRLAALDLGESNEKQPEDAIQWLIEAHRSKGNLRPTADDIAQNLFVLMTASIHATSATGLSILFDLLDYPESLAEITQEILDVQNQLADKRTWTRQGLGELKVLDSFMRESMRVHTFTQLTVQRMVASKPYTFKDGLLTLPVGATISFANSEYSFDSAIHPDAHTFDPKRHLRKRQQFVGTDNANKFHFASTEDTIVWGSGPHACPGRFFAQEVLQMIFVHFLTMYDIKYPPAENEEKEGQGVHRRPPSLPMGFNIVPNVMAPLLFKTQESATA